MKNKKYATKNKRRASYGWRSSKRISFVGGMVVFAGLIAIVAGGLRLYSSRAYTGHHAKCTLIHAKKYTVKTNETFGASIHMNNNGTSTFAKSYGFYLGDPYNTWKFSGNQLSQNIPPAKTAVFDLKLHAPAKPGSYKFSAQMAIAVQGFIPAACPTRTIVVAGLPNVSITDPVPASKLNGTAAIRANASNNVPINKVEFFINSKLVGADTSSPYSYSWNTKSYANGSYTLTAKAYDSLSQTKTSPAVKVTVSNAKPSSGGGGSTGGSTTKPSSGGSGSSSGGQSGGSAAKTADKKAPTTPSGFQAVPNDDTKSIDLSWDASSDNVSVTGYQLQRAENNQEEWTTLSGSINQTSYQDVSAAFGTTYYYRVKAFDAAGNSSEYAITQASSGDFSANVTNGKDATISSEDESFSVLIPAGSLSQNAFCALTVSTDVLPPNLNGRVSIAGPYELSCRDSNGNTLTKFDKSFVLSAHISSDQLKNLKGVSYYAQNDGGDWQNLKVTHHDKKTSTDTVDLQNYRVFTVMANKKSTPIFVKILIILVIIAIIIVLIRFISGRLLRRKAEADYDDYLRKAKGL